MCAYNEWWETKAKLGTNPCKMKKWGHMYAYSTDDWHRHIMMDSYAIVVD